MNVVKDRNQKEGGGKISEHKAGVLAGKLIALYRLYNVKGSVFDFAVNV
jgi:hypothetical protein